MDNKTTMPGVLTLPGTLYQGASRQPRRSIFYKLIFGAAALALVLGLWLL